MGKTYWAVTYFLIGYAIVAATVVFLYQIPGSLKASIGMVTAAIVFVDLSYRYFKRTTDLTKTVSWHSVIKLMTFWAILSIGLDTLLLVIVIPLVGTGSIDLSFFYQQPLLYWIQFPMFYVFGFVAQLMHNRVMEILSARFNQLP